MSRNIGLLSFHWMGQHCNGWQYLSVARWQTIAEAATVKITDYDEHNTKKRNENENWEIINKEIKCGKRSTIGFRSGSSFGFDFFLSRSSLTLESIISQQKTNALMQRGAKTMPRTTKACQCIEKCRAPSKKETRCHYQGENTQLREKRIGERIEETGHTWGSMVRRSWLLPLFSFHGARRTDK